MICFHFLIYISFLGVLISERREYRSIQPKRKCGRKWNAGAEMIDSLIFENGWGKPTALRPMTEDCIQNESGSALRSPTREDGRFYEIRISGRRGCRPLQALFERSNCRGWRPQIYGKSQTEHIQ